MEERSILEQAAYRKAVRLSQFIERAALNSAAEMQNVNIKDAITIEEIDGLLQYQRKAERNLIIMICVWIISILFISLYAYFKS